MGAWNSCIKINAPQIGPILHRTIERSELKPNSSILSLTFEESKYYNPDYGFYDIEENNNNLESATSMKLISLEISQIEYEYKTKSVIRLQGDIDSYCDMDSFAEIIDETQNKSLMAYSSLIGWEVCLRNSKYLKLTCE